MIRIYCADKDAREDQGSKISELWKQDIPGVGAWGTAPSVFI